jgi:hypothetical protein
MFLLAQICMQFLILLLLQENKQALCQERTKISMDAAVIINWLLGALCGARVGCLVCGFLCCSLKLRSTLPTEAGC